ncbi:MAG: RhuM family protein, partial [bacterium]
DPSAEASQRFFQTVQNKMHWAAHGHTAAEVIARRADAAKPNMGLTNWPGSAQGATLRKADVGVAKNYLNKDELDALNLIVSFYLDFAELQAKSRREMTMAGWISKLDDFLRLSERDILTHAGKVSHDKAMEKAEGEYARFAVAQAALPSPVERHFDEAIGEIKRLEGEKKKPESPASGERPTSPTPKKKPSKKKGRKK